jgi:hypothetical protein
MSSRPKKVQRCHSGTKNPPTSAQAPQATTQQNLTLYDWMTVYAYVDAHPTAAQGNIVRHFATLKTGQLIFDQSTLSHKLREHLKLESCINDNPAALTSKWPCIVTSPLVEHALVVWVQHMEGIGEVVTGPML